MADFDIIEKEQVVPQAASKIEPEIVSNESSESDDAVESIQLLLKSPSSVDEETDASKRAAKILLTLVASMVASQLMILGIALFVPRSRMVRVSSLVVSQPGTLVLKQENAAGIDLLFIFFHPIPALIEVSRKRDHYGFINYFLAKLEAGMDTALQLRDSLGRHFYEWAARLVSSRPYQQLHKLLCEAFARLGLPS